MRFHSKSAGLTIPVLLALPALLAAGCQRGPAAAATPAAMEEAASAQSQIVGLQAPDFTLKDQNDRPVTLSKERGKWVVLYFYPKDDTPGCTCEATEFTQLLWHFGDMNAKIYGVSTDSTFSHKVFVEKFEVQLDLLSDPNHEVMARYGAWVSASLGETRYGRTIRSTMLIDPGGVIRYHWPEVLPKGHAQRVRQRLAKLQGAAKK